jgi:hypothetical protein
VSSEPPRARRIQFFLTLTLPVDLLIVAIAIHPALARDLGVRLNPLETEAIVVSLLLFLGINYGWLLFMEPAYGASETQQPEEHDSSGA